MHCQRSRAPRHHSNECINRTPDPGTGRPAEPLRQHHSRLGLCSGMTPDCDLGSAVMGASGVSLREITDYNREAVLALCIAPSQQGYVSSVADSLEEARGHPEGNPWFRAIYAD